MLKTKRTQTMWCVLFLLGTIACGSNEPPLGPVDNDHRAPNFSIETMDGQSFVLHEQRGKPVVLNFWGTWCPPCIQELPELNQLAITHNEIVVLGIAVRSSESEIEKLQADLNLQYSMAQASTQHPVLAAYEMDSANAAFPTTYVIGPRGDIVVDGIERATDFDELQRLIKPHLTISN